jgi:hypothetical protein
MRFKQSFGQDANPDVDMELVSDRWSWNDLLSGAYKRKFIAELMQAGKGAGGAESAPQSLKRKNVG